MTLKPAWTALGACSPAQGVIRGEVSDSAIDQKLMTGNPVRSYFREYGLPLLLLGASVVTTTANGARFMRNFVLELPPVVRDSDLWPWGRVPHPSRTLRRVGNQYRPPR